MNIQDMEQQIEVTRHELDQTLEALQAKLSPTRRLKAAWDAGRVSGLAVARNGVDWVAAHPVPILAAGAALVLALSLRPRLRRRGDAI